MMIAFFWMLLSLACPGGELDDLPILTSGIKRISSYDRKEGDNDFYQVLSPSEDDQGVWIHQDVWFHLGEFSRDTSAPYQLKKEGNGIYIFVLDGDVEIEGQSLSSRDGLGVWETSEIQLTAKADTRILLMEIPMSP